MRLLTLVDRSLFGYLTLSTCLGIFIDQNLTLQKHTEYILQRTRGQYIFYITCGHYLTQSFIKLHCGFILPIFDYCVTTYVGSSNCITYEIYGANTCQICSHMCNDTGFLKVTLAEHCHFLTFYKYIKFYITLYLLTFRIYLCILGVLLDLLIEQSSFIYS